MTEVLVGKLVELDQDKIESMPPVYIDSINVFQSWSYNAPISGNKLFLPAIVVNNLSEVPSDIPIGTAILVRAT